MRHGSPRSVQGSSCRRNPHWVTPAYAAEALRVNEFARETFGGVPTSVELALGSPQHAQGAVERALAPLEFALALTQFEPTSAEFAFASAELAPATL